MNDATLVGLLQEGDEEVYRDEVCYGNYLSNERDKILFILSCKEKSHTVDQRKF